MEQLKEQVSAKVDKLARKNTTATQRNQLWLDIEGIREGSMHLMPRKDTSTRECKRVIRMKRAYNRAKKMQLQRDWVYFKTLVKTYNQYISDCVSPDIKNNPKTFFTFIKSQKCENVGVPPFRDKGKTIIDDEKNGNILNNQISSIFSEKDDITPVMPSVNIPSIYVMEEGVINLLNKRNPHKASGPDGIPARFLKECAIEIAPALTLLFNVSLQQGIVPFVWKQAMIYPMYKPGTKDRSNADNYRPISLRSVTCKILEHIIINHLDTNNTLTDAQHGFRKRRSCETQLVTAVNEFSKALNDGKQLGTTDKVDHYKLCIAIMVYEENQFVGSGNS